MELRAIPKSSAHLRLLFLGDWPPSTRVPSSVMKMEQTLRARFAGAVKQLKCKVGDIVQEGVELAEVELAKT